MARTMTLPKIGVNLEEITLIRWLVKVGDMVNEGDPILEAETDKATQEFYSTESGILAALLVEEGDIVAVGAEIAVFVDEGAGYAAPTHDLKKHGLDEDMDIIDMDIYVDADFQIDTDIDSVLDMAEAGTDIAFGGEAAGAADTMGAGGTYMDATGAGEAYTDAVEAADASGVYTDAADARGAYMDATDVSAHAADVNSYAADAHMAGAGGAADVDMADVSAHAADVNSYAADADMVVMDAAVVDAAVADAVGAGYATDANSFAADADMEVVDALVADAADADKTFADMADVDAAVADMVGAGASGADAAGADTAPADAGAGADAAEETPADRLRISPLARKVSKELGIDPTLIPSSMPDGRITAAAVLNYAEKTGIGLVDQIEIPAPEPVAAAAEPEGAGAEPEGAEAEAQAEAAVFEAAEAFEAAEPVIAEGAETIEALEAFEPVIAEGAETIEALEAFEPVIAKGAETIEALEEIDTELYEPADVELFEPADVELFEPADAELFEPADAELFEPADAELFEPAEETAVEPAVPETAEPLGIGAFDQAEEAPEEIAEEAAEEAAEETATEPAGAEAKAPAARTRLSGIRRTIAVRLSQSAREKPTVALTVTANAEALISLRKNYKLAGRPLSVDAVLARSVAAALKLHPALNAAFEGDEILTNEQINIGVAIDTPAGLVVPVAKNVDKKPLAQIGVELDGLLRKAVSGRLSPEEMQDGTFTITNLGVFGVEEFIPIINPPECAILAAGAIIPQYYPDETGNPALKKLMKLTLVFDHRIVDGAPAARFLSDVKQYLECPGLML